MSDAPPLTLSIGWIPKGGLPLLGPGLWSRYLKKETLSPKRRDLAVAAVMERVGDAATNPDAEYVVRLNRALYL
jgi:hypothetical protein